MLPDIAVISIYDETTTFNCAAVHILTNSLLRYASCKNDDIGWDLLVANLCGITVI